MPFFRQPRSVPADTPASALRVWTESTEAEARADIGRFYSQTPTGLITNQEITRLLGGAEVTGKLFRWSSTGRDVPWRAIPPMFVCTVCGHRQTSVTRCPKCHEGYLVPIGEAQREIAEASRT